jgi:hypothetical protein
MDVLRQPVAAGGNGFGLFFAAFRAGAFAAGCHWLRPLGSIKAPYSAGREQDSVWAGMALSEERQLNGYRVRLRVVEEYDA